MVFTAGSMEDLTAVVSLFAFCISGACTLPVILEEAGAGTLCDYTGQDSDCEEEQYYDMEIGQNLNVLCNSRQEENVISQCKSLQGKELKANENILETIIFKINDQVEVQRREQDAITEEASKLSEVEQSAGDQIKSSMAAEETKDKFVRTSKVKRSSLFDDLEQDDEIGNDGRDETNTMKNNGVNKEEEASTSKNFPHDTMTTKPWFWSWLFKSAHPSFESKNVGANGLSEKDNTSENKDRSSEVIETPLPQTQSSETEEEIKNLEIESDHYDQDRNDTGGLDCKSDGNCGMNTSDNFTEQIQNEEAILKQEIQDQNPGPTTTEAVWNTDEFIAKTS